MKAILKYNLSKEKTDFNLACKAGDITLALWDMQEYLRKADKYESGTTTEQIRKEFHDILEQHDINLDNLIE